MRLECQGLTTRWYANLLGCCVTEQRRVVTRWLFLGLVSVWRNRWLAVACRSSALLPVLLCNSLLNININNVVTWPCQQAANLT
jgi:hypothetical protein